MREEIRPGGRDRPRGRRRGDAQRKIPVGAVRRSELTGRRIGMQPRDRRGVRRSWILPSLAIGVTVVAMGTDIGAPRALEPLRQSAEVAFAPVQRVLVLPPSAELETTREERDRLADELRQAREQTQETEELASLLEAEAASERELVPARVIGFSAASTTSPDRRVTLDVGANDGIARDLSVVSQDGLVGRVQSVTDWTAEVVVLGDPQLNVGVRTSEGVLGAVSATTPPGLPDRGAGELTFQAFGSEEIAQGDEVVTIGGDDSPFAPGVLVGEVTEVDPQRGQLGTSGVVTPAVEAGRLQIVGVVMTGERTEGRDVVSVPERSGSDSGDSPQSSSSADSGETEDSNSSDDASGGDASAEPGPSGDAASDDENVELFPAPGESVPVASDAPSDVVEPSGSPDPAAPTTGLDEDLTGQGGNE